MPALAQTPPPPRRTHASFAVPTVVAAALFAVGPLAACKRTEPAPNPMKSQREAMDRAKEVGTTMQKGVDAEGKKADADGK